MFRKTLIVSALLAAGAANAAPFMAGDLVIYRVGTVTGSLTSAATQVFLDEYTSSGSLVQSIAMPTAVSGANLQLTASGTATSEGELTRSSDGRYLVLTGYNAAVGTASVGSSSSATTARTVGLVDANGTVNTTTGLTDFSTGNNARSAVSSNGTDLWVAGGAGGIRYATIGGTTSTQISTTVSNNRQLEIFGGQLYSSDSSGTAVRIGAVGAGLPTTAGQTIINLPGIPSSTGSPYSFFMADLDAGVAGLDTLYVADDAAGIMKYSLIGGSWQAKGTAGTGSDAYRGLTGIVSGGNVQLFATAKGGSGATGGGSLVSIFDGSGYGGTLSTTTNVLATAAANEAFRGIALAPVPEPESYALLLAGLGMVGFVARRRKH